MTFGVVVAFFVLGCLANLALLSLYLRLDRFALHFQSEMLWRRSLGTAALGVGALLNGGFINGFSQSAEGYRLAKRDSAAIHLLFHGIPCVAAASVVAVRLDCQHRSCAVQFRGSDITVYLYFLIVVAAPIIWWQVPPRRAAPRLVPTHRAASSVLFSAGGASGDADGGGEDGRQGGPRALGRVRAGRASS